MGKAAIEYIHRGIVRNGILVFDNPSMYEISLNNIGEGKRFELIIGSELESASKDQYGFFYGGIIGECLESNHFGGWDKDDIKDFLIKRCNSYSRVRIVYGEPVEEILSGAFPKTKAELTKFINKCILYLETDFDPPIIIKNPNEYKLNLNKTKNNG